MATEQRQRTAEDMLSAFRAALIKKVELAENVLRPLYNRASEAQQILMMGPLDEALEAERLLEALAATSLHLSQTVEPVREHPPRKRPPI